MQDRIRQEAEEHISLMRLSVHKLIPQVVRATECVMDAFRNGGKLLVCGNGGSAADAQHFAAEFVGKFREKRAPLPAIALTTDTSALTAIGNDFSFSEIFSRQVEAIGVKGDVLMGISTSGESANVLRAVTSARAKGMKTIGLSGAKGALQHAVDIAIVVPSESTPRIQEVHEFIGHMIGGLVEENLFSKS